MPDWKVTATTVFCDAVNDEVTFIVTADGTASCTGREKYFRKNAKRSGCTGDKCEIVKEYAARILGGKEAPAGR